MHSARLVTTAIVLLVLGTPTRADETPVKGKIVGVDLFKNGLVSMVIRRRFSGELIQVEGAPRSTLLTEGVTSINRRNELDWSLSLKPAEETKLKYSYSVLVLH